MSSNHKNPSDPVEDDKGKLWNGANTGYRLIYDDTSARGFSIGFVDFLTKEELEWSHSFHDRRLNICINLEGNARFCVDGEVLELKANQCAIYISHNHLPKAVRNAGEQHRFYTLELSHNWLQSCLLENLERTKPIVKRFVRHPDRAGADIECIPLPFSLISIRKDFLNPPVGKSGEEMWYRAKVIEVLAHTIYLPTKSLTGAKTRNRLRVERAKELIEQRIAAPPSLETIAHEVECSMYHLSRTFKEAMGMNVSDYQRAVSMNAAATFLQNGMSVSEAAAAVGYRSPSAFIHMFQKHYQMTPSQWVAAWRRKAQ